IISSRVMCPQHCALYACRWQDGMKTRCGDSHHELVGIRRPHIEFSKSSARMLEMDSTDSTTDRYKTGFVPSAGGSRKDGSTVSEFAVQPDTRIDGVRHRIHEARSSADGFLVENLIDDLQNLMELAGRNDVDTGPIAEVIQAETGALPVIPSPEEP